MAFVFQPSATGTSTPSGVYQLVAPKPSTYRMGRVYGRPISSVNNPLAQVNSGGIINTGDGSPLGNPNYTCAAGPEVLPSEQVKVPLDVGTSYIFQHYINASGLGVAQTKVTAEFDSSKKIQQHNVAFDLYQNVQSIEDTFTPTRIVLPLRTAVSAGGFTLQGGAATTPQALANPGDGKYVSYDSLTAGSVTLQFNPLQLETDWTSGRIVGLALRWVTWKDDDSEAVPGEGFKVQINDTTLTRTVELGSWLVQEYQNNAQFITHDLGETNPIARGKTVWPARDLHPFTVEDLIGMNAANNRTFFIISALAGDITQTTVNLDYIELLVDVIPEQRHSCAIRNVSNARADTLTNTTAYDKDVELRYPLSSSFGVALSTNPLDDYFLVVREARPADTSDYYRAKITGALTVGPMESFGPSLLILGVLQTRGADQLTLGSVKQLYTSKSAVVNDQVDPATIEPFTEYRMAVAHYVTGAVVAAGSFWAAYRNLSGGELSRVYSGQARVQRIWLKGGVTYDRVRALIKPYPTTNGDAQFQVYNTVLVLETSTPTFTAASIRAMADEGNGWREVNMGLSVPITPASDGWHYLALTSTTGSGQPWLVAAAEPMGMQPYFSYDVPADGIAFGTNANIVDYAMLLACDPGTPAAPQVAAVPVALVGNACEIANITYNHLIWTADGKWDQYVLVYKTSTNPNFVIASNVIDSPIAGTVITYNHYAVPWDVTVQYALVGHRGFDLSETLGTFDAGTFLASGSSKLGISEIPQPNDNTISYSVYTPTSESGELEIEFTYLTPMDKVSLHAEDYQRVLVPREDLGRAFTVNLLVTQLTACTGAVLNSLTPGQRSLDGSAMDFLQGIARYANVFVQFPGGVVRMYIMELGTMRGYTTHGVFATEVTFTPRAAILLGLLGASQDR